MKNIKTILVDDEALARKKLSFLLARDPSFKVVGQCSTSHEAIECIYRLHPDLMFLDIQMPGDDGFTVLKVLEPGIVPATIFTTAFDQYAVRAFEAHALDYLLKPFDDERFFKSLQRAKAGIAARAGAVKIRNFIASRENVIDRFVVKSKGRILFLNTKEIDWIEAATNYVNLHVGPESHQVRHTMNDVEKKLDPTRFIRVHRSVIVNIDRVKELRPCNSGEFIVTLKNGRELPASRGFRGKIDAVLQAAL